MTTQFSETYSKAYDLLNTGKPYSQEVEFLHQLFKKFGATGTALTSVLDLGCGSGKHLAEFPSTTRKFGVDQSHGMLAEATARGLQNFDCAMANICTARLGEKFDLVYSLFHVISYQTTDLDLVNFFRTIRDHLKIGAIGVIDYWHRAPWDVDPPLTRVTKKSDQNTEVIRISTPKFDLMTGRVEIDMDLFVRENPKNDFSHLVEHHEMRAYTLLELSQAAQLVGLSVVASGKWMNSDVELSAEDWYGWLACQLIEV